MSTCRLHPTVLSGTLRLLAKREGSSGGRLFVFVQPGVVTRQGCEKGRGRQVSVAAGVWQARGKITDSDFVPVDILL